MRADFKPLGNTWPRTILLRRLSKNEVCTRWYVHSLLYKTQETAQFISSKAELQGKWPTDVSHVQCTEIRKKCKFGKPVWSPQKLKSMFLWFFFRRNGPIGACLKSEENFSKTLILAFDVIVYVRDICSTPALFFSYFKSTTTYRRWENPGLVLYKHIIRDVEKNIKKWKFRFFCDNYFIDAYIVRLRTSYIGDMSEV